MTERHPCGRCERPTTDTLCGGCVRHAQRVLDDIRGLVRDLDDTVTRQTRVGHLAVLGRGRNTTTPLPFADSPRITRAHEDLAVLTRWASHVSGRPVNSDDWGGATDRLRDADMWFRGSSDAALCVDELHMIRTTLRAAVDRPPTLAYFGRCGATLPAAMLGGPGMDTDDGATITLEAVDTRCNSTIGEVLDGGMIKCRGCDKVHTPGSRNASAVAAMSGAVLPLDVILDALPHLIGHRPKPHTVRTWLRRGRLAPATWVNLTRGAHGINTRVDEAGNPLYLADDVLTLVRDAHARPGPRRKDVPA